jgi:hypothetical protein
MGQIGVRTPLGPRGNILEKGRARKMILKNNWGQLLVAHACNPTYSGGRDGGSKPVLANSSQAPISKKKKNHKNVLLE